MLLKDRVLPKDRVLSEVQMLITTRVLIGVLLCTWKNLISEVTQLGANVSTEYPSLQRVLQTPQDDA